MMRNSCILLFCFLICVGEAKIVPTPFVTEPHEIQRLGWQECEEHWGCNPFSELYGVSVSNVRTAPSGDLVVFSDPTVSRVVYCIRNGSQIQWLKAFPDNWPGYSHFRHPKGISIDTATYMGHQDLTFIYVVDAGNNRIARLKYSAANEIIELVDYIGEGEFYKAHGICCASDFINGGSYMVVGDAGNDRIVIYKMHADGSYIQKKIYGSEGTGVGQFNFPQGVTITQISGQSGNYFIYVADKYNHRVVCLKYYSAENTVDWVNEYIDPEDKAWFSGVTTNPYYCVYVTDEKDHKIWVFTAELNELLYTYGVDSLPFGTFVSPCEICIIDDELCVTEDWNATTGLQYFKIIPEIREFYPEPQNFDATEDSVKINFRVDETAHYLTMEVAGRKIFEINILSQAGIRSGGMVGGLMVR